MTSQIHVLYMTAEVDAWSRDFDYEDYIDLKTKRGDISQPLSRRAYGTLRALMNQEMVDDFTQEIET